MNLTDAVVGLVRAVSRQGRIERLLEPLGWQVDERRGKTLGLYFKTRRGRKTVCIAGGDDALVAFVVYSDVKFDSRCMPETVTGAALVQNDKSPFGKWELYMEGDDAAFRLTYAAIGDGLTPAILKKICESMVEMVSTFEGAAERNGYL